MPGGHICSVYFFPSSFPTMRSKGKYFDDAPDSTQPMMFIEQTPLILKSGHEGLPYLLAIGFKAEDPSQVAFRVFNTPAVRADTKVIASLDIAVFPRFGALHYLHHSGQGPFAMAAQGAGVDLNPFDLVALQENLFKNDMATMIEIEGAGPVLSVIHQRIAENVALTHRGTPVAEVEDSLRASAAGHISSHPGFRKSHGRRPH